MKWVDRQKMNEIVWGAITLILEVKVLYYDRGASEKLVSFYCYLNPN